HLGPKVFEEVDGEIVQSTAFVLRRVRIPRIKGDYIRLVDKATTEEKKEEVKKITRQLNASNWYEVEQINFSKIPGTPIAYWLNENVIRILDESQKLNELIDVKQGSTIGNNDLFLRLWHEVNP